MSFSKRINLPAFNDFKTCICILWSSILTQAIFNEKVSDIYMFLLACVCRLKAEHSGETWSVIWVCKKTICRSAFKSFKKNLVIEILEKSVIVENKLLLNHLFVEEDLNLKRNRLQSVPTAFVQHRSRVAVIIWFNCELIYLCLFYLK